MRVMDRSAGAETRDAAELVEDIRSLSQPLRGDHDLDPLMERIGDARYVLLGEASHGTSEYYTWRAGSAGGSSRRRVLVHRRRGRLARLLPREPVRQGRAGRRARRPRGAARLRPLADLDVGQRGGRRAGRVAPAAQRPACRTPEGRLLRAGRLQPVGLAVRGHRLPPRRPTRGAATAARRAFRCFEPYGEDVQEYARATALVPDSCEDEVIDLLLELRGKAPRYPRRRPRGRTSTPSRTPWSSGRRGVLPRDGARPRIPGTSATGTWPRRWSG